MPRFGAGGLGSSVPCFGSSLFAINVSHFPSGTPPCQSANRAPPATSFSARRRKRAQVRDDEHLERPEERWQRECLERRTTLFGRDVGPEPGEAEPTQGQNHEELHGTQSENAPAGPQHTGRASGRGRGRGLAREFAGARSTQVYPAWPGPPMRPSPPGASSHPRPCWRERAFEKVRPLRKAGRYSGEDIVQNDATRVSPGRRPRSKPRVQESLKQLGDNETGSGRAVRPSDAFGNSGAQKPAPGRRLEELPGGRLPGFRSSLTAPHDSAPRYTSMTYRDLDGPSCAGGWVREWAHHDSNMGPHPYQGCALAN